MHDPREPHLAMIKRTLRYVKGTLSTGLHIGTGLVDRLTASSTDLLHHIIQRLHSEFAMTDLGDLHHFLGISVTRSPDGLFLSQRQYALDLL